MSEPCVPYSANEREVKWTIRPMIDFELPIFDQNQAQIARAYHEYRQRYAEYDGRRQAITAEVRETKVMYEQAYEQVRFFRDAILPEVERNLEVVRESYRAGREDVTIILQVQEDLIMTRLSALGFLRDLLINRAELERQVGGGCRRFSRQ
jgi:outer membrane protein TolC